MFSRFLVLGFCDFSHPPSVLGDMVSGNHCSSLLVKRDPAVAHGTVAAVAIGYVEPG